MQDTIEVLSSDDSDSDPDPDEVKLTSSPNVITVSCCENMIDVTTQTVQTLKPVTCRCDEVMQKLEDVLDGLNRLQDELCTQSCDLLDVRNRCVLIEKQMDHIVHAHVHVSCMTVQHVHIMYYFTTLNCTCTVLYIRIIQHPPATCTCQAPSNFSAAFTTTCKFVNMLYYAA